MEEKWKSTGDLLDKAKKCNHAALTRYVLKLAGSTYTVVALLSLFNLILNYQ